MLPRSKTGYVTLRYFKAQRYIFDYDFRNRREYDRLGLSCLQDRSLFEPTFIGFADILDCSRLLLISNYNQTFAIDSLDKHSYCYGCVQEKTAVNNNPTTWVHDM